MGFILGLLLILTQRVVANPLQKIKNIKNMAENEENIVDVIIEPDPTDPTEELKKGLKSNHFLVIKDSLENGADLRIVYKDAYDSIKIVIFHTWLTVYQSKRISKFKRSRMVLSATGID